MKGVISEQGNAWNAEFGIQFDVQNLFALQWFDEYTLFFAQQVNDTSRGDISAMLQQAHLEGWDIPTMERNLGTLFDQYIKGNKTAADFDWFTNRMPPHRRAMIARTETMRASNAGSFQLFKGWGSQKKEWLATGDDRTRPTHLAAWANYYGPGKAIPIDDWFLVGSAKLMYPGDPGGDPNETIQCRCAVLPVIGKPEIPLQEPGNFTSEAAATRWMAENYPHIKTGFKDIHIEGVNEMVKEFDRLAQKYPDVAKRVSAFGSDTGTNTPNPYINESAVVAWADSRSGAIIYDSRTTRDWATRRYPGMPQSPEFGRFLVQDTNHWKLTTAHEFGHQVDFWLDTVNSSGETMTFLPILGMDGTGMVRSSFDNWRRNNKPKTRSLSRYATTNDYENVAESFAAMETVPRSKWTKHVRGFDKATDLILDTDKWESVPYNDQIYISDLDWNSGDRERAGELVDKWRQAIEAGGSKPTAADYAELLEIAERHRNRNS